MVIKQVMAAVAVAFLSGCGGKAVIESDMSRLVAASPSSPWLTVDDNGQKVLVVPGLASKEKVQVTPGVAAAVESRLRRELQPKYFTDLIINCRKLEASASVAAEAEPPTAGLDLSMNCHIVARGLSSSRAYRVHESLPVQPAAPHLERVVPALLEGASKQLADQLWADVLATGVRR